MDQTDADVNINECKINELLPALFQLQSQRCTTYQRLYDAQLMFLNTQNFPAFQNFLADITIIFKRISEEILSIKKRFEEKKLIFKHIEQLQDYEQKKLQFTNDLFVAKVEKKDEQIEGLNGKLIELVDNINEVLEELRYDQEELTILKIMSDNTQQTIVDLLNQASVYGKDNVRVQHLRHVQELILRKDPNLLEQFLEEVLTFQTDKSIEVKKTIIAFIEEACQINPKIILRVIDNLHFLLYDDNIFVQKKLILSLISIYKSTLIWLSKSSIIDESIDRMWRTMTDMKNHIISQLHSDNDGLCIVVIKFIEMLIIIFIQNAHDFPIHNDKILSRNHCEQESKDSLDKLIEFILLPHLSNTRLIAAIEAMTCIIRYKSDYISDVLPTLEKLLDNFPSTLNDSQIDNVRKIIKLKLFNLLKYSVSSDSRTKISLLLTNLGCTQTEILKYLPKTHSQSKRKLPSNDQQTQTGAKKLKNITDTITNLPEREIPLKKIHKPDLQHQAVTDLMGKLSIENVVDLVLLSMRSLPEEIPLPFHSIYTPIRDAGSSAQIKQLAHLLNTQFIEAGYDITKFHPVTINLVDEMKEKQSTAIKMDTCISTKKIKSYKLSNVVKPMEYNEMQRMSMDAFHRILNAKGICENACVNHTYAKIISSLVCLSEGGFRDIFKDYLLVDIYQRYDLALAWIYKEYVHAHGYLTPSEVNKTKDLTKYDQLLCQLLEYLQDRDHELFARLLTDIPFITDSTLRIFERYCQNQVTNESMKILRHFILHRMPIREKSLNILLTLTQHEHNSIRTNAIDFIKILYQRKEFKQDIERYVLKSISTIETMDSKIQRCFSLYLNLIPLNYCLIQPLVDLYGTVNENTQQIILQVLEVPIREMGTSSSEILQEIKTCPNGAEALIVHIIHVLTEHPPPSEQLVKNIRDLYHKRISDVRFLLPILPYLDKCEIKNTLPELIKLPPSIVKEVFERLLSLICPISPSELFIALHEISLEECELKIIINATTLCLNERSIYTDTILAEIIEQLVEMTPIPLLFMRTVLQTLCLYPKMVSLIMNILQRLITKQVWKQPRIWDGFIKCCEKTRPHSFPLLLQLPSVQLEHVFQREPMLHESLRLYLRSMSIAQRSSIPSSIVEMIINTSQI